MTTDVVDSDRIDREREFHDDRFGDDSGRESAGKFYAAVASATVQYSEAVLRQAEGDCLEYGCGTGALAFDLAAKGCRSAAIDISPVAIETAEAEAKERGLDVRFEEMNAEAMTFESNSFDLVYGSGILHHLDIERATAEVVRVLRPGGRAVFLEPMGYNPLINAYRRATPAMRTVDEHPLLQADLTLIERNARDFGAEFHGLTSIAAAPFIDSSAGKKFASLCHRVDQALFAVPKVGLLAWMVVIEMTAP